MMNDPTDPKVPPSATAEGEEQDLVERSASERDPRERMARREEDDPREDDGWSQPESSAQKAAVRDEEEG
jgi:hypothetical protein